MRPTRYIFAALGILLGGCASYAPGLAPHRDEGVQWGEPAGGLKVGAARRTYAPGHEPERDRIYLTVRLLNVTDHRIRILAPLPDGITITENLAGDETVKLTATYDGGAGIKTTQFTPSKKPIVQAIEPGQDYRVELRLSPAAFGLDRFAAGRMSVTYSNAQDTIRYRSMNDEPVTGLWTGNATSGAVNLGDVPATTRPAEQGGGVAR